MEKSVHERTGSLDKLLLNDLFEKIQVPHMLNSTKEEIYDEIRVHSMSRKVSKFDIPDGIRLEFNKNTSLWIEIITLSTFTQFKVRYSLFEKAYPIKEVISFGTDDIIVDIQNWLLNIESWIAEQQYSDPWEKRYKKYNLPKELSEGIVRINFRENEPFSDKEKEWIQHDLEISKLFIKELRLPEDRSEILEEKIDLLIAMVENQNKVTWLKMGKDIIVSAIVNAATGSETLMTLSSLFGKLLKVPFNLLTFN